MRKLVFHLYLTKDWRTNWVYKIHFNCLKYYRECFDKAYFALDLEDKSDIGSLVEVKQKLVHILNNVQNIEFETVENNYYYESQTFKNAVVDRIGKDDLVFFAHIKGVRDAEIYPLGDVIKNICTLYYLSLNPEKETHDVTEKLKLWSEFITYGSLLIQFDDEFKVKGKYDWIYAGTFFWLNSRRLNNYINTHDVKLPEFDSRFYSENFLCNVFPIHSMDKNSNKPNAGFATAYRTRFLRSSSPDNPELSGFIAYMIEGEENKFEDFILKITQCEN